MRKALLIIAAAALAVSADQASPKSCAISRTYLKISLFLVLSLFYFLGCSLPL